MNVVVHGKDGCPWCEKAKDWLIEKKIPFIMELHNDDDERNELYDRLGLAGSDRAVPQVMVHDEYAEYRVGGYDQLTISGVESLFQRVG